MCEGRKRVSNREPETEARCGDMRATAAREADAEDACAAVSISASPCAGGLGAENRDEMDVALAQRLCGLTSEFYLANADSFSQTRQAAWQGWSRVLRAAGAFADEEAVATCGNAVGGAVVACDFAEDRAAASGRLASAVGQAPEGSVAQKPFRVLDLACGNLRFERYVAQQLPEVPLACFAVDNCEPLVEAACTEGLPRVAFQKLNVIDALVAGNLTAALDAPLASCDLAVSFGFMHHVPLECWRVELLRALISRVRSDGHVAVSFWRFLNSEKLAKKARETTAQAHVELGIPKLPPNDFLLGWQETRGLYRYCHHFDEREIDRLLSAVADVASPIARFSADGKTGNLNEYVVLQVR